ncbi:MAG: DNA mismatch repair protein MutS [Pseudomonadota bacterium]
MMAQYLEIKAQYEDALLFYRMGDFYELFFNDAVIAAATLDIALTKRGKHLGQDIPMCGVPVHAAETYLLSLIRNGHRVAVCEQMEDPAEARKRGSKAVVRRDVVRLVTPGTLTEDSLLEARSHNYLAAFASVRDMAALAWVDISTGIFRVLGLKENAVSHHLARIRPSELIVADGTEPAVRDMAEETGAQVTPLARAAFDSANAGKRLCDLFNVATLDAFGQFDRAEIAAMGAVVEYLEITQKGKLPLLRAPTRETPEQVMQIDAATRRNLEISRALGGGRGGSLLATIDRTATAGGGRLLDERLSSPSRSLQVIHARQGAIACILNDPDMFHHLRDHLRRVPDLDRAVSRLALDRGGPRDLAAVRDGLREARALATLLARRDLSDLLAEAVDKLVGHDALQSLLDAALVAEPPLQMRDGGFIATGHDPELDEARRLRDEGRGVIAGMQAELSALTGIQSLKIKHNNVLGYFVEVTAKHAEKMLSDPLNDVFRHRQTTASQVRFTTADLSALESRILNAGAHALEIEKRLYSSLKRAILDSHAAVASAARALAELDVAAAMADLARSEDWCCPTVDQGRALIIEAGRHPVVEQALKTDGMPFVSNDLDLGERADIWLLTGPNMAGKSTFLRQNALIVLLAQIGAYVPARAARIGLVSQLFSRVGASDDLARGRSTFMVEMVETAAILNQADGRALVILDEIGRGTATYDGLSIAWATLEHLHGVNGCRALFATHYHEMTRLADTLDRLENATVSVKEHEGDVIFLHEVQRGAADRSYGVQVARLAGLPEAVISRARIVLGALERGEREGGQARDALVDDLPLFSASPAPPVSALRSEPDASRALDRLAGILPDELSPREALDLIYELRALLEEDSPAAARAASGRPPAPE